MKYFNHYERFCKALEYHGIDPKSKDIDLLVDTIRTRADSDREVDSILDPVFCVLEPPSCKMGHCEHHTVYGFCNCSQHKTPGRCKKHRDFMKRQQARAQKIYDEGYKLGKSITNPDNYQIPDKYKHNGKGQLFHDGAKDGFHGKQKRTVEV